MKFINILFLIFVLFFSWTKFNSNLAVSEEVHVDLQAGLKNIITDYINEELPSADNIVFHKFWSETINRYKVKISFIYSFNDIDNEIPIKTMIEGSALLNKNKQINDNNPNEIEYWTFNQLLVSNQHIDYKKGITISIDKKKK